MSAIPEEFVRKTARLSGEVTRPFPSSRKIYVQGSRPDLRVPMREVSLTATHTKDGVEENPTTVHVRTLVTQRYKLTVYRDAPYGELFDLQTDPGELHNCWDDPAYAQTKADLLLQFVQAEIQREPTRMPRIAGA